MVLITSDCAPFRNVFSSMGWVMVAGYLAWATKQVWANFSSGE